MTEYVSTKPSAPDRDLIAPEQIKQMIQDGISLSGETIKDQAKLVAQILDQYFKKFAEESTSLGPLTLNSPPELIEAYQKIAVQHGRAITLSTSPLEEVDSLHNQFASALLREGYKLWAISPTHRTKITDDRDIPTKFYQRLYHYSGKGLGYLGLLQRDAVSEKPSTPHAHWSIEAYTPIFGETKLFLGVDSDPIDLKSVGTAVVVPGQVHAIVNPKGVMTLTFLEIIGDPTSIRLTPENRNLLDSSGSFPKQVWIQEARAQGFIK